jgi:hypothetical protein
MGTKNITTGRKSENFSVLPFFKFGLKRISK